MMINTSKPIVNDAVKIGLFDSHNETTECNRLSTIHRKAEQVQHEKGTDNMEADQ
jgi:hypothetical protein